MCAYRFSEKAAEFNQIAKNGEIDKYQEMLAEMKRLYDEIVSWWGASRLSVDKERSEKLES